MDEMLGETPKPIRNRLGVAALTSSLLGTVLTTAVLFLQQLPRAIRDGLDFFGAILFLAVLLLNFAGAILGPVGLIWRPRRYSILTVFVLALNIFLLGFWLQEELARMP